MITREEIKKWKINSKHTVDGINYTVVWCPVCSSKTLDNYYVCEKCGWQYMDTPDDIPDIPKDEYIKLYNMEIEKNPSYKWIEGKNIKRKGNNTNEI